MARVVADRRGGGRVAVGADVAALAHVGAQFTLVCVERTVGEGVAAIDATTYGERARVAEPTVRVDAALDAAVRREIAAGQGARAGGAVSVVRALDARARRDLAVQRGQAAARVVHARRWSRERCVRVGVARRLEAEGVLTAEARGTERERHRGET